MQLFAESVVLLTMATAIAMSLRQIIMATRVALGHSNAAPGIIESGICSWSPGSDQSQSRGRLPTVQILVPAHNEEKVIGDCLDAIVHFDYPRELYHVLVVNDRSTDTTGQIADNFAAHFDHVSVLHRADDAAPGKSAALADGLGHVDTDIIVLFDADYIPKSSLLRQLVAPFADPSVGATMGRVVPINADANLLTRLLDLERRAGYGVDQNGRGLLNLVPQFGGTVGGIRRSALEAVGGWRQGLLTEDTDLTFRLLLRGWRVAYVNDATCYEEVPQDWQSRFKQVRRWAYGHNECLGDYFLRTLVSPRLGLFRRLDALLILLFYFLPVLTLISLPMLIMILSYWSNGSLVCYLCGQVGPVLAATILAPYLQMTVAAAIDRQTHVLRVLPLMPLSSIISVFASSLAVLLIATKLLTGQALAWDKTRRFRTS